jgi:nitric oxide reductase large subunit
MSEPEKSGRPKETRKQKTIRLVIWIVVAAFGLYSIGAGVFGLLNR